ASISTTCGTPGTPWQRRPAPAGNGGWTGPTAATAGPPGSTPPPPPRASAWDLRFSAEAHPLWNWWERRLELLMPTDYRRSLFVATIFPEVTALVGVLAATRWRVPACRGATAIEDRLIHIATTALECVAPLHRGDLSEA